MTAPIKQPIIAKSGFLSRVWIRYFSDYDTNISLNDTHRNSNGTDHTFIDQDVTTTSSPTFTGITVDDNLTVDSRDVLRYMYLVAN